MTGRRRPRADERGAVAIVVAVLMSAVLVTVAAYAVDLGLQRVARTDMQSLADVVSLDLARELDGRPAAEIAPTLPALAAESLQRTAAPSVTRRCLTPSSGCSTRATAASPR